MRKFSEELHTISDDLMPPRYLAVKNDYKNVELNKFIIVEVNSHAGYIFGAPVIILGCTGSNYWSGVALYNSPDKINLKIEFWENKNEPINILVGDKLRMINTPFRSYEIHKKRRFIEQFKGELDAK